MNFVRLVSVLGLAGFFATAAAAVNENQFLIRTAGDLAALCGVSNGDPHRQAAIHMCEGYLVGVHQMHMASTNGSKSGRIYCLPEKGTPSRDQVATEFSTWVRQAPAVQNRPAIEGVMLWASNRYPCS